MTDQQIYCAPFINSKFNQAPPNSHSFTMQLKEIYKYNHTT